MGFIGRNSEENGKRTGTTVVSTGTQLVGDLTLTDNLHVDGRVQGNVKCETTVAIGRDGHFEGDIQAEHVLVCGNFEGTIDARRLEIVAGGRVNGTVESKEFVIESGGQFNGSSRLKDDTPRQLSHQPGKAGGASAEAVDESEEKAA